jgi:hypothetical protein
MLKELSISFLVFFCIISCSTIDKTISAEKRIIKNQRIDKGFTLGEIFLSNIEGDCPVTIKIDDKNGIYYLDPINLEEKYHIDGLNVWFKYGGLRRMNRCQKANPITINEIVTD